MMFIGKLYWMLLHLERSYSMEMGYVANLKIVIENDSLRKIVSNDEEPTIIPIKKAES